MAQQQQQQMMLSPRLDKATKAHINKLLRNAVNRTWCKKHGKALPPPKLPPVVLRVIKEWFQLVDDDGSGTLEHHELLAALQAARIPCDAASITEMIKLMDANCDGCISWDEFEAFMMNEFAAGQQLLSGEFVLPSGTALPFGSMIRQLKRNQMMSDVTKGGEARTKWLHFDIDLTADAAELQQAEEAIRIQKEYNETMHTRETPRQLPQQQQQGSPRLSVAVAPATTAPAAGGAGGGGVAVDAAVSPNSNSSRPAAVPRLQLASLSGSGGTQQQQQQQQQTSRIISNRHSLVGLLTERQTTALLSCLPGSLEHLVGSPRLAGLVKSSSSSGAAAAAAAAATGGSSTNRSSRAPVGAGDNSCVPASSRQLAPGKQPHDSMSQPHAVTARSARGAAEKYGSLCSSARTAAATAAGAATGTSALDSKQTVTAAAAAGTTGRAARAARGSGPRSCIGSSPVRPFSAGSSTAYTAVQPQPSRDEWRAVAASCLTHRLSGQCRSPRLFATAGGSSSARRTPGVGSSSGGGQKGTGAAAPHQQQQPGDGKLTLLPALPQAATGARAAVAGSSSSAPCSASGAAAATTAVHVPGFSVHQWEHTGASPASSARRTQRSGAAAAAAALSSAGSSTGRAATGSGNGSSSNHMAGVAGRSVPTAAQNSLPHSPYLATAPVRTKAALAAAAEPPPPTNDSLCHLQPRVSCRIGRGGAKAAVNSPRSARHAAAAAAYGVPTTSSCSVRHGQQQEVHRHASAASADAAQHAWPTKQHQLLDAGVRTDLLPPSDNSRHNTTSSSSTNATPRSTAVGVGSAPSSPERQPGSVLDASCKWLLSACAVPPAALLSPRYVGPVEAAVASKATSRLHATPRRRM